MRGEIEGKRFSGIAVACTAILFFCFAGTVPAYAGTEEIPEAIARIAEQIAEDTGSEAAEECLDYYWELLDRPLNINSASEASLRRLNLLSEFQIRSLADYIAEFGAILSDSELTLVSGFNAGLVALIRPFITFSEGSADGSDPAGDGTRQDAMLRADRKFTSAGSSGSASSSSSSALRGLPVAMTAKYRIRLDSRWEAGLSVRESAYDTLRGGFLPTFTSAHAALRDIAIGKGRLRLEMLAAGDFTARFGQGLTMWKAFPVTFVSQPASLCKSESGISPYTSSSGTNFLRGIAGTISWAGWSFSAFGSSVGPHTVIAYSPKKASHNLAGANLSHTFKRFKVGATFVAGGRDTLNAGLDFYISPGWGWRIFGEAAASLSPSSASASSTRASRFSLAPAALLGAAWSPEYGFEAAALIRSYSESFISPDAGAFSTLSKCANQQGITLSAKWLPGNWSTACYVDAVYHAAPRYGIKTSSAVVKSRLEASRTVSLPHPFLSPGRTSESYPDGSSQEDAPSSASKRKHDQSITLYTRLSYTYKTPSEERRAGLRIELEYSLGKFLTLDARLEGCAYLDAKSKDSASSLFAAIPTAAGMLELGALAYQDIYFKLLNDRLIIRAQLEIYRTSSWKSRIYCYEYDLPQTFSIQAFYGPVSSTSDSADSSSILGGKIGISGSGVVSYRTRHGLTIWLKSSTKLCRIGVTMRL